MYSVIIPTYNRCQLLSEAIDSVVLQEYPDIEIIVVDDGSNDATAQMLAQNHPYVRYFYQKNQGPAAARNKGIAESGGEIIAFLDSDDVWLENKIALELALLQGFPEAAMLAGNGCAFVESQLRSQDTFAQRNILFKQRQPRFFDWSMSIMQKGPVCCTSGMTFRKATLAMLGDKPFDETLRLDEDWDLEFRLFSQFKVLLYPDIVCKTQIFNDGTRHFYSAGGQPKTQQEQQYIWRQQRDIIGRYLNNPYWGAEAEQCFQERYRQLTELLV